MPNFFQAPPINTYKPFEPPEFDVIRQMLATQYINMAMNPFGVQGAQTGSGIPLPPSWSPYGVGGAAQGTPGARWNASTGAYGGGMTAPEAGGGVGTPGVPGAPSAPPAWSNPHDAEYDSSTLGGGQIPQEPGAGGGSLGGQPPQEGQNTTTPGSGGSSWGMETGQMPNWGKVWNSGAANNPWAGMNESQFRSSMGNNVGGGGIFGLQRALGSSNLTGAAAGGPTNLPGFGAATGGRHEMGGNPFIGTSATQAGWNPQQTAAWTVNGLLAQNPGWGQYLSGGNQPGMIPGFSGGGQGQGTQTQPPAAWPGQGQGPGGATPWPNLNWQPQEGQNNPTGAPGPGWGQFTGQPAEAASGSSITGQGTGSGEGLNTTTPGPLAPPPSGSQPGSGQGGNGAPNPWSTPGGFPWTQGYQGQFTAPMNPTELGAMGQYQNYINALGQASPSAPPSNLNPWAIPNFGGGAGMQGENQAAMNQITGGLRGWQNYENNEALRRIQSSASAGGGALSGANMQAQADYLNNANNLFNQTTGTMQLQNLQSMEALQNALAQSQIGAGATLGASGQYAGAQEYGAGLGYQENMANLQNQAIQNLFGMGQVGQNTEQNQYNAAYNDWLRQTGNMQSMFNYPAQLALAQLGYGYPASQPNAYGTSQAAQWTALLQQLLGGGGGGGGYGNIINQIVNGYNQGSGGGQQPPPSGTQGDAEARYDGGTSPSNPTQLPMDQVQGRDYWLNLLNQSIARSNQAQNAGQPSNGAQTASGILSLLNLLAGGGAGGGARPASSGGASFGGTMGQGSAGSGQGLGLLGLIAKGVGALINGGQKQPGTAKPGPVSANPPGAPSVQGAGGMGTSTGFDPNTGMPAGASMTTDTSTGLPVGIINPQDYNMYGQPTVIDPNNQNQPLADYLSQYQTSGNTEFPNGEPNTWGYGEFGNYSDPSAFGTDNSGDVSGGDAEDAVQ